MSNLFKKVLMASLLVLSMPVFAADDATVTPAPVPAKESCCAKVQKFFDAPVVAKFPKFKRFDLTAVLLLLAGAGATATGVVQDYNGYKASLQEGEVASFAGFMAYLKANGKAKAYAGLAVAGTGLMLAGAGMGIWRLVKKTAPAPAPAAAAA